MKDDALEQMPMRHADDESGGHALYDEYVRGFDEVPVLRDAVALPPRRVTPDFRKGERPDNRSEARPDPYSAREAKSAETAALYAEYVDPEVGRPKPKKKRKPKSKSKNKKSRKARASSDHHGADL